MNLSSTFSSPLSTSHSLWLPASTVFIHLSPSTLHLFCSQPSISPFRPLFLSLICQSLLFFFYTSSSSFLRSSISCSLPPPLSVDEALCPSSESSGQVWINLPDKQRAKERKKERKRKLRNVGSNSTILWESNFKSKMKMLQATVAFLC